ncbi:DIS3 [Cordylochernes scorpioides]|uniref:DIS3 n=1 Tax=Cordylochernes scorpioides TaxID=51811 RepID=A0ABY6LFW7_9ARAC|nr:DIS3 [Cordylochernes scorpioides]
MTKKIRGLPWQKISRFTTGKKILYPEHLPLAELLRGIRAGKYHQGKFQASRTNYLEGFVFLSSGADSKMDTEEEGSQDSVLIQGRLHLNRAVHDDLVAVELLPKEQWSSPSELVLEATEVEEEVAGKEDKILQSSKGSKKMTTAKVVGIVKRNWRPYCGMLQSTALKDATRHLFIPSERRITKVRIETRQAERLASQRLVVAIDRWPRDSYYPRGHYVRALGPVGERNTENEVLLLEHDIPHDPFSPAVLACLPSPDWKVTPEKCWDSWLNLYIFTLSCEPSQPFYLGPTRQTQHLEVNLLFVWYQDEKVRRDLRHIAICSVDPPGCTDIDDALHCCPLDNGNYNLDLDFSEYILEPNPSSTETFSCYSATLVKQRGDIVAAVQRIDMVPDLLSSNLCSLRGNEERFAFSVLWEMTPDAQIVSTTFGKSIIRSRAALTYGEAQMRIDDVTMNDDVTLGLRGLNRLAKIMKRRRIDNGALTLASSEVRFSLDSETHDPIDVESKKLLETNSMVEEFMLQANISVALHIHREFPECALLRRHPQPPLANFEPLTKAGGSKNFEIKVSSGKELADSLDAAVLPEHPYFNVMLRMVATRCMTQALYFSSGTQTQPEFFHYGLAVPFYTHFTSPIRRYADVIVHRMLAASIGADTTYPQLVNKRKIQDICNNLNYRHKNAQYAGRSSVALYTQIYFKEKPHEEEGYVLFVKENALQVLVPKYGLESTLYLSQPGQPSPFCYNEKENTQTIRDIVIRQFDPVTISLSVDDSNLQRQKLRMELIKPEIPELKDSQPPTKKQKTS